MEFTRNKFNDRVKQFFKKTFKLCLTVDPHKAFYIYKFAKYTLGIFDS